MDLPDAPTDLPANRTMDLPDPPMDLPAPPLEEELRLMEGGEVEKLENSEVIEVVEEIAAEEVIPEGFPQVPNPVVAHLCQPNSLNSTPADVPRLKSLTSPPREPVKFDGISGPPAQVDNVKRLLFDSPNINKPTAIVKPTVEVRPMESFCEKSTPSLASPDKAADSKDTCVAKDSFDTAASAAAPCSPAQPTAADSAVHQCLTVYNSQELCGEDKQIHDKAGELAAVSPSSEKVKNDLEPVITDKAEEDIVEGGTVKMDNSEEDEPLPPAKGYNLDFLAQLDDPNFNPFETKTAIKDNFGFTDDAPTLPGNKVKDTPPKIEVKVAVDSESKPEENKSEEKKPAPPKARKAAVKKPWEKKGMKAVKKTPMPPKPVEEDPKSDDDAPPPPVKAYNLDFLDKLDDPNFNPFETKTAIVDKFGDEVGSEASMAVPEVTAKPKLEKPMKTEEPPVKDDNAETVSVAINEKPSEEGSQEKVKKVSAKKAAPKPWLKKKAKKWTPPPIDDEVEDDIPPPAKGGYNLDFLTNMDDPNFNPFETKAPVVNDASNALADDASNALASEKLSSEAASAVAASVSDKVEVPLETPKAVIETKDSTPEFEDNEAIIHAEVPRTDKPSDSEEMPPPPSKGYDMDFLDNLEDPNYDPFKTKTSVMNDGERPSSGYNMDFLDNLEDPNFNPFETKSSVNNDNKKPHSDSAVAATDTTAQVTVEAPSNREEQNSVQLNTSQSVPSSNSQLEESFQVPEPTDLSAFLTPPALADAADSNSDGVFLRPAQTMGSRELEKQTQALVNESYISLPRQSTVCLNNMGDDSVMDDDSPPDLELAGKPDLNFLTSTVSNLDDGPMMNYSIGGALDLDQSVIAAAGGDITMMNGTNTNITQSIATTNTLTQLGLMHEAKLLEKDRALAEVNKRIMTKDREINDLKMDLHNASDSNRQMMGIVEEYEKTISQLIAERERERVCHEIEKDRVMLERNQVLDDLQAVERAFNDLHKKYERTKEVVSGFKGNEDMLKASVEDYIKRFRKSEERYDLLKTHAETKLQDAGERLDAVQKSKAGEIAKLQALLRKAEMRVTSLERAVEQKTHENQELTTICDELISKVGSS